MEHLLAEIAPWVSDYGLRIVFFGTILEGTTMILVRGIFCYLGLLPLGASIVVAILGAVISDQFWYLLGKYYADKLLDRFPKLKPRVEMLMSKARNKSDILALGSRFIYSGALLFPVALGMQKYPHRKFTFYDTLGVTVWVNAGIALGYFLGTGTEQLFGKIKTAEHLSLLILAVIASVWWYKKRQKSLKI